MSPRVVVICMVFALAVPARAGVFSRLKIAKEYMKTKVSGKKTVDDRIRQYAAVVESRVKPAFEKLGVAYPPRSFTLIGLKEERRLELWAPDKEGKSKLVLSYPVLAASGVQGPKLEEGDGQVPEGFYGIESLNPNSIFHLSLRVNYPNDADKKQARRDGRTQLGGDIMIHGNEVSIGCLAMGDKVAENLFVLAALAGASNIKVLLVPYDFRAKPPQPTSPSWVYLLYKDLAQALSTYK